MNSSENSDEVRRNENGDAGNGQDLFLHFLDKVRLSRGDAMEESEGEESPTELNTINSAGGFLIVSPDKLSVKYTNTNLHGDDVGVVQANKPAPFKCLTTSRFLLRMLALKGKSRLVSLRRASKCADNPGTFLVSLMRLSSFCRIGFDKLRLKQMLLFTRTKS